MMVNNYINKIKEIRNAFKSINVTVDENEMVQICLVGPTLRYGVVKIVVVGHNCRGSVTRG